MDEQTTSSSPTTTTRRSTATDKAGDPSTTATTSADRTGTKETGTKETGTKEGRRTGRSDKEGSRNGRSGTSREPAAAAPPTAPPTTPPPTPPPPPPDAGRLDRMAVLAWAKAHRGDTAPPAYSGPSCGVESVGQDAIGDDADGDLTTVSLARDCLGTYRASVPDGQASGRWIEIDAQTGGCDAVDVMAFVWSTGSSILGAVVATPTCDPASWSSPGPAGAPGVPDGGLIDFAGSTFGDPTTFGWRAGMLGSAEDTQIDLLPDAGFTTFER